MNIPDDILVAPFTIKQAYITAYNKALYTGEGNPDEVARAALRGQDGGVAEYTAAEKKARKL